PDACTGEARDRVVGALEAHDGRPAFVPEERARAAPLLTVPVCVCDGEPAPLAESEPLVPPVARPAVGPDAGRAPDLHAVRAVRLGQRGRALGATELGGGVEQHSGERAPVMRQSRVEPEREVDELVEHHALRPVAARERDRGTVLLFAVEGLTGTVAR